MSWYFNTGSLQSLHPTGMLYHLSHMGNQLFQHHSPNKPSLLLITGEVLDSQLFHESIRISAPIIHCFNYSSSLVLCTLSNKSPSQCSTKFPSYSHIYSFITPSLKTKQIHKQTKTHTDMSFGFC